MMEVGWVSMTATEKGEKGRKRKMGRGKAVDEPSPDRPILVSFRIHFLPPSCEIFNPSDKFAISIF